MAQNFQTDLNLNPLISFSRCVSDRLVLLSGPTGWPIGAVIGTVIGAIIVIIVLVLLAVCLSNKRYNRVSMSCLYLAFNHEPDMHEN